MGKLDSSLLLHSIVNDGMNLSSFHYSFARYFKIVSNHMETLNESSMSFRQNPKTYHHFNNVDDALTLFNEMIEQHPKRSIVEFTKLLVALVRMRRYATVVSLYSQMELLGVSHNDYFFNILINCFCQLGGIDSGFSVLVKMLKLGVKPDVVTFSTLIKGLCKRSKISQACLLKEAHDLFFEMSKQGINPNVITYTTLIDTLYKKGVVSKAKDILGTMKKLGIEPNVAKALILEYKAPEKHHRLSFSASRLGSLSSTFLIENQNNFVAMRTLKNHLDKTKSLPFVKHIADFHLLLFLAMSHGLGSDVLTLVACVSTETTVTALI
ncbi:pentatricopeptide repeat-containing protein At1g06580-like [Gossypium arboreum]|uniref:pentatricopeptide repeat-containing protein At1g06580-like n=1 Tax=Gossypium arboreum TaxID=29729 RepID=UPI0008195A37|nr:pentatricopeptide repeat-containing protein At1g06580-like [Gossypium arboreum]